MTILIRSTGVHVHSWKWEGWTIVCTVGESQVVLQVGDYGTGWIYFDPLCLANGS